MLTMIQNSDIAKDPVEKKKESEASRVTIVGNKYVMSLKTQCHTVKNIPWISVKTQYFHCI